MTRFTDGPAAGNTLLLARSPLFLRVTTDGGKIDALDRLDDVPRPGESLTAYRRVSLDGGVHVDSSDKRGRRVGEWYSCATYSVCEPQPPDEAMRDRDLWRAWCWTQVKGQTE